VPVPRKNSRSSPRAVATAPASPSSHDRGLAPRQATTHPRTPSARTRSRPSLRRLWSSSERGRVKLRSRSASSDQRVSRALPRTRPIRPRPRPPGPAASGTNGSCALVQRHARLGQDRFAPSRRAERRRQLAPSAPVRQRPPARQPYGWPTAEPQADPCTWHTARGEVAARARQRGPRRPPRRGTRTVARR
jgi:hypothetical protein